MGREISREKLFSKILELEVHYFLFFDKMAFYFLEGIMLLKATANN